MQRFLFWVCALLCFHSLPAQEVPLWGGVRDSIVLPADSSLVLIPNDAYIDEIVAFGKSLVGRPYRSGGKTPAGFDCSGFLYYTFGNFGYKMPSHSGDYAHRGAAVSYGQWEKGDFLLFSGRGRRGIGHVALVIAVEPGAVWMLHSGSPGVVVQNFLAMPYYTKRYVGARRLFMTPYL